MTSLSDKVLVTVGLKSVKEEHEWVQHNDPAAQIWPREICPTLWNVGGTIWRNCSANADWSRTFSSLTCRCHFDWSEVRPFAFSPLQNTTQAKNKNESCFLTLWDFSAAVYSCVYLKMFFFCSFNLQSGLVGTQIPSECIRTFRVLLWARNPKAQS